MTDTSQYCVMKVRECESCDGSGLVPFMGRGHAGTGCIYCAGTGKAWEPVPLAEALGKLLEEGYLEGARRRYLSWKEAGGIPHVSEAEED